MTDYIGTFGDDRLRGGGQDDSFDISQGGADTVRGVGGDDSIYAGAAFTADDHIDGGNGADTLTLEGDYSGGLVFQADTLLHVEKIQLAPDHSYDLTLSDRAAASNADGGLSVGASGFLAGDRIHIDATGFQAGRHLEFAIDGAASATVLGGAGADTMVFASAGAFDVSGGGGDDTVALYRAMTQADHFDGGDGTDTLVLFADQTTAFTGAMLADVETLWAYGADFHLATRDTAVAAGHSLLVYGGDLTAGQHLAFDGSRESDGTFTITGGADNDTLTGGRGDDSFAAGAGDDRITGGQGGDLMSGEDGADTFVYAALADSGRHGGVDLITDLTADDTIDLSAIDARSDKGGDQAFRLVAAFDGHAGELMLSYDAASDLTTLAADVNGDGRADMSVHIAGDQSGFTHFVL